MMLEPNITPVMIGSPSFCTNPITLHITLVAVSSASPVLLVVAPAGTPWRILHVKTHCFPISTSHLHSIPLPTPGLSHCGIATIYNHPMLFLGHSSIGTGTASPVRAVFSSAIADGDTFLMGEMAGVDEGLVIQELSRADELVKLQHELEKQVGKLAELGELKWLEQLETLQTEEIQKVKDSIGEMEQEKIREVEAAREAVVTTLELKEIKEQLKEEGKQWGKKSKEKLEEAKRKIEEVKEKIEKIKVGGLTAAEEVKKEIEKLKGLEDINKLLEEVVKEEMKEVVAQVGFNQLKDKKEWEKLWSKEDKVWKEALKKLKVEEIEAVETVKKVEGLKEKVEEVKTLKNKLRENWKRQGEKLEVLKDKLEELETIKGVRERLKEKIEKINAPGDLEALEAEKIKEVKTAKGGAEREVEKEIKSLEEKLEQGLVEGERETLKVQDIKEWEQGLNEQLEALKKLEKSLGEQELVKLTAEEVEAKVKEVRKLVQEWEKEPEHWLKHLKKTELKDLKKKIKEIQEVKLDQVKELKSRLEELAAIRELKELGLEERLRELAGVKEVKRLAERQKDVGLDAQEGLQLTEKLQGDIQGRLQLTEKIRALGGQLDLMEARKIAEVKVVHQESVPILISGAREKFRGKLEELRGSKQLEAIKDLGELVEEVQKLQVSEEKLKGQVDQVKHLKRKLEELEEIRALRKLGRLDELVPRDRAQTLGEMKAALKRLRELAEKEIKEKSLVERSVGMLGWLVGFGDALKGKELVDLEKKLSKIKALEELTEIAEKRGVATVMKAALTSAMEITENRGWTDYLNGVDSKARSNLLAYSPTYLTTQRCLPNHTSTLLPVLLPNEAYPPSAPLYLLPLRSHLPTQLGAPTLLTSTSQLIPISTSHLHSTSLDFVPTTWYTHQLHPGHP